MIIPHILNNLKKYGISPSTVEQQQLLLKQNLQLVKEINEMKIYGSVLNKNEFVNELTNDKLFANKWLK